MESNHVQRAHRGPEGLPKTYFKANDPSALHEGSLRCYWSLWPGVEMLICWNIRSKGWNSTLLIWQWNWWTRANAIIPLGKLHFRKMSVQPEFCQIVVQPARPRANFDSRRAREVTWLMNLLSFASWLNLKDLLWSFEQPRLRFKRLNMKQILCKSMIWSTQQL